MSIIPQGQKANKENYPEFRPSPHSKMGTPGMRQQPQSTVKTNPLAPLRQRRKRDVKRHVWLGSGQAQEHVAKL